MWSDLVFRMRAIFRRRAVELELDNELRFHLEHETEKLIATGFSREEAARQAMLAIGGLEPLKEECRGARGVSLLETTLQDVRYAIRGMRRAPLFTAVAVMTLGLGAGAIATVFTLANTLLFRPLPVERADEVVIVQPTRQHGRWNGWISYPDYARLREQTRTLTGLAAHYSTAPLFVQVNGRAQEVNGAVVSANFFPVLGLQPAAGRFFDAQEDRVPDRDRVAVVSHEFWRAWLGSAPDALQSPLKINGALFTIIGVMPESFRGVTVQPSEIYIPTMMARSGYRWCEDAFARDCTVFDMIGRLRNGFTAEQVRAEMQTLVPPEWRSAKEGENSGLTASLAQGVSHPDLTRRSEARFVELLLGVASLLLLVCCVNQAGLLIARNDARSREFAIRTSLGAGSTRLVRQLLTESVLLAITGGLIGAVLSLGVTSALNSMFYSVDVEGRPLNYNFQPDMRVILGVIGASVAAGFLAGFLPALRSIRAGIDGGLQQQSQRSGTRLASGGWLAAAQASIAVTLAGVAGLLATSSYFAMKGTNVETSHVALMRLRPRLVQYAPEKAQRYLRTAMERLQTIPGVESASMVGNGAVLTGRSADVSLPDGKQVTKSRYSEIAPRYFETLRIPLLRGRDFDAHDSTVSGAVAIVSAALARRLWPAEEVIGALVTVNGRARRVVGVVEDVTLQSRMEKLEPAVYVPFWQNAGQVDARLCVRVHGDPSEMLPGLIHEVNRIDPDVPIAETIALPVQMAGSHSSLRITAAFVSGTAALAVILSGIGLYGVLAFSVSRRTKEIGIRVAIGARSTEVLMMIVRQGMSAVSIGMAVGIAGALAATRLVRHLLYGSGRADVFVYTAGALVVALAGLIACWIPARRAASVAPMAALREQ